MRLIGNDIFIRNNRVGYIDPETDTLYAIVLATGFAEKVDTINHRSEAIGKLSAWREEYVKR